MTCVEVLTQIFETLQVEKRMSYETLKSRCGLDEHDLEDLKTALIQAKKLTFDKDGVVLACKGKFDRAWAGDRAYRPPSYTPKHLAETVLTSRKALEGERKHATVLFADLHNSTGLAQTIDPEVLHDILDDIFELMLAVVHRVEGTINQFTGDGIMALFGAPVAYEDHAVRALHAALGIRSAFALYADRMRRSHGLSLALRIGLHTGPVVVGKIGNDLRMDYTAQGFTTHLANRIQKIARHGAVFVSEAVHRQAAHCFRFHNLGSFILPGITEPVQVYECVNIRQITCRLEASPRWRRSVFTGRQRELALLRTLWHRACRGQGQAVYLIGDAGVGKSRLAHEFRSQLGDPVTLEVQTVPYWQSMPYHPFNPLLRALLELTGGSGSPQTCQQTPSRHSAQPSTLVDHMPSLSDLLGMPLTADQPVPWYPEEQKRRLQHFCRQIVPRLSTERPLYILIEDVQWLDSASHELLELLISSLAHRRILLLCTVRSGFGYAWDNLDHVHVLTLETLSDAWADALMNHCCRPLAASKALRTRIRQLAGGNPLFVEELLRSMREDHLLRIENGKYVLREEKDIKIPASVQGILAARIDRLESDLKEVLLVGAVIGREFPLWLIETVSGQADLSRKLDALSRSGLIHKIASQPEPVFRFKHALIREVAYESLLNRSKNQWHGVIAQALENRHTGRHDEQAQVLHGFRPAEHGSKVPTYDRQAVRNAHGFGRYAEVVRRIEVDVH